MTRTLTAIASLAIAGAGLLADAGTVSASEEAQTPPVIQYGESRASSGWVSLPNGTRVGVGKGVTWKGVTVYLSLTWDLVAVDAESGKALFGQSVGAFWRGITFKEVTPEKGSKQWAIELRPSARARGSGNRRQYHDLRTGKQLDVAGLVETPSGTQMTLRAHWHGAKSQIAKKFSALISTEANWAALKTRLFDAGAAPALGAIDFAKEVALVLSSGDSMNCRGISFADCYDDKNRLLLRIDRLTFQTMNGVERTRPWGIFVLPRHAAKAYVVERNAQGLINGPAIWRQAHHFEKIAAPETQLARVPAATDQKHEGWDGAPPSPVRPK